MGGGSGVAEEEGLGVCKGSWYLSAHYEPI